MRNKTVENLIWKLRLCIKIFDSKLALSRIALNVTESGGGIN